MGARQQGTGGSYVLGVQATHLQLPAGVAAVSLGQERQGSPGKKLQDRSHRGGSHLMAPDGSKVLPAVGTAQLHWVDRWPSEQDGQELGDYRNKTWAQPWMRRSFLQDTNSY